MRDFEWGPAKAKTNLAKHGVDFEVAKNVFLDPAAMVEPDDSDSGEERWRAIGLAGGNVLLWCLRSETRTHHLGTQGEQA